MRLNLDLETYNEVPITVGSYKYAETAEIMLVAISVDDGPADVWDLADGEGNLTALQVAIDRADEIVIQNSGFDRPVLAVQGITIPVEKIHDTMVCALMHSLPGKLEALCEVLGVPADKAKDRAGKKLINLFCRPRPKNMKIRRATKETHPEEWAQFVEYARLDIVSMCEVWKRLPKWNYTKEERELWLLDQRINDRGVKADLDLAKSALRAFDRTKADLGARTADLTGGAVTSLTQRDRFLDYLDAQHDFQPKDMQKGTVAGILKKDDISKEVRELLVMRQQAAAASPAKYKAVLSSACRDGRLRGMIQFCGASRTGRASGRIVQLQNLPRPTLKPYQIEYAVEAMKLDCEDLIYDNVSEICVNAIRGCLVAAKGKKLVVSDLSNIEGRVAAWLADERWKIKAFEDFDAGKGHDLYKLTAARILGKRPEDVTKDERQGQGKVPDLSCQYGGAVGAFAKMGANYGVVLREDEVVKIIRAWRAAHPKIVSLWYALEDAARNAIREPTCAFNAGPLRFDMRQGYMRIRLPSGRFMTFAQAHLSDECRMCVSSGKIVEKGAFSECPRCFGAGKLRRPSVRYWGVDQYTRKWTVIETWGGKLLEGPTQAIARDVFLRGLRRAEEENYPVVIQVHDELGSEVPDDPRYSAKGLSALMVEKAGWMMGLPLAAAGGEMYRYGKGD